MGRPTRAALCAYCCASLSLAKDPERQRLAVALAGEIRSLREPKMLDALRSTFASCVQDLCLESTFFLDVAMSASVAGWKMPRAPGMHYNHRASYVRSSTYDDVGRIASALQAASVTVRDSRILWFAEENKHPLFGDNWQRSIDWYQYVRYVRHREIGRLIVGHERQNEFRFDFIVVLRPDTLIPASWLFCGIRAAHRSAVVNHGDSVWLVGRDVGTFVLEFVPNTTNYGQTSLPTRRSGVIIEKGLVTWLRSNFGVPQHTSCSGRVVSALPVDVRNMTCVDQCAEAVAWMACIQECHRGNA